MEFILQIGNAITSLGSTLMIPVMITLMGLIVRCKPDKAIKAGITVGIGLIGLNLVMNLVWENISPVSLILVEKFNLNLSTVDTGWATISSVAFSTTVGTMIIPFTLLVNVILMVTGCTRTIDIDVWNYWHFAFAGSVVAATTGNLLYGFIAAAVHITVSLCMADRTAKYVEKEMKLPGVSIPQGGTVSNMFVFYATGFVYDLFEKKNKEIKTDKSNGLVEKINNNAIFKIIKDPVFLGFILGTVLGLFADYALGAALTLGMQMAALMILLPRMVKVLMEGLLPLSNATKKFLVEKFNGREVYIGMDPAILLGHPTTLAVSLILIPIVLIEAMILPGNIMIPMADLASTAYWVAIASCMHGGNFVKVLIDGIVVVSVYLLIGSYFAPAVTSIMQSATSVSAMSAGEIMPWITDVLFNINGVVGIVGSIGLIGGFALWNRSLLKKESQANLEKNV